MDIGNQLLDYIIQHSTPEDKVLRELYRETNLKVLHPRMISGHLLGKLMEMLSCMIRPEKILEIGTYTGYSAICLAKGLAKGGKLHTIEINDELRDMALDYFVKAGVQDKVVLHSRDALEIIPELKDEFDLVFIDGNKQQYLEYYKLVFPKVKLYGYIFADNVLWDGKVLKSSGRIDKYTKGIIEFNAYLVKDNRVEQIILPFRDCFSLVRKNRN